MAYSVPCDIMECSKNISSQDCNNDLNSSGIVLECPENTTVISNAFLADLISEKCEIELSPNKNLGKMKLDELKGSSEDSPDLKESASGRSLKVNISTELNNQKEVTDANISEELNIQAKVAKANISEINIPEKVMEANIFEELNIQEKVTETNISEELTILEKVMESNISEKLNIQEKVTEASYENEELRGATVSSESLSKEVVEKHNEVNKQHYRCEADSWTEDDSSSSFSLDSSSDCSDSFLHKLQKNVITPTTSKVINLKTRGELDLEELPPIQDLTINVKDSEIEKIGHVHAIVERLVVVHSMKDLNLALDTDSVLFLTSKKPLGRIFEVFGPVTQPFYLVRFNSPEHIKETGVETDLDVFYAPKKEEITTFVFVDELRKQKGSDASWQDNNEPPEEYIDYSDDEQERAAKQKRRAKNRLSSTTDEPISNQNVQPPSTFRKDVQKSPRSKVAPVAVNTFRSVQSNAPTLRLSNHVTLSDVMSSVYRPNSSRPQNSYHTFQGPPIYAPPRNSFNGHHQSGTPQLQLFPAPQPRTFPQEQPFNVSFRSSRPYEQHPQHRFTNGPPTSFSYPSSTHSPLPPHQSTISQPVRCAPSVLPEHPVAFQQPHVFGQMTPLGPMSPAMPQTPLHFAPTIMSPPPFVPVSMPQASPNFSYFSHEFVSSPPPTPVHTQYNMPWFQTSVSRPPPPIMGLMAPMSPLSIQIPNNLRTPPPTIPVPAANGYNTMHSNQPQQNTGPFVYQARSHPF